MPFAELAEQTMPEELGEPAAPTFRVVGANACTGKERVVAAGLSREAAEAMRQRMRRDVLCHGFAVWIEDEGKVSR
jgi:hypothetical protein